MGVDDLMRMSSLVTIEDFAMMYGLDLPEEAPSNDTMTFARFGASGDSAG